MSESQYVVPWEAPAAPAIPNAMKPPAIVDLAIQLRPRERQQIVANFKAEHYEVASTYIWLRTMNLLKKRLASLGNEFLSELLQRPDIDENTDITTAVSDSDAIALGRNLGILTATQAMRLIHAQDVVNHFASGQEADFADEDGMSAEEAVGCLKVCVQSVLGHQNVTIAENFAQFRVSLAEQTFDADSPAILNLLQSPYFFIRTAISVLLSVLRSKQGAQIEHAARNAKLIVPMFWEKLKEPEKWQIGQAYASEFNEGRSDSVKILYEVLLKVKGFDFVPETLRSHTFTKAANNVIAAHQGMDNFYNEPGPMRELANLGTSIPGPAVAICITALLCVKVGNPYGVSRDAQIHADKLISSLSRDRWLYYFNGRLDNDLVILPKFIYDRPLRRWIDLMASLNIETQEINSRTVRDLVCNPTMDKLSAINRAVQQMLRKALDDK